ncbi:MAG: hypothetical protein HY883_01030 [Deltaproteobacteria bacterium]|nr:hypothetical protein [Deltaproteobacteria bacterium]
MQTPKTSWTRNYCKNTAPAKRIILAGVYIFSTLLFLEGASKPLCAKESGAGMTLSTDKPVYSRGEPIEIGLRVFNHTGKNIVLYFNSTQRYDFIVKDKGDKEVWRFSSGRAFAMFTDTETIGPKRPVITYSERLMSGLKPGVYKITGLVTDRDGAFSGLTEIEIKE